MGCCSAGADYAAEAMSSAQDIKPRLDPAQLRPNQQIQRRPCGRFCSIERINDTRTKALVKDNGRCFWVKVTTLVEKWA